MSLFGFNSGPQRQPRFGQLKNKQAQKLLNHWWSKVFYNNDNLQRLAGGCPLYAGPHQGLVYCYIIGGRVRYVGQTRENSLKRRMTKRQSNNRIGYRLGIRRRLLNAERADRLQITTELLPVAELDRREIELIELYGRQGWIWNVEHNPRWLVRFVNYFWLN